MSGPVEDMAQRAGQYKAEQEIARFNQMRDELDTIESDPNASEGKKVQARRGFFERLLHAKREIYDTGTLGYLMATLGFNWLRQTMHHAKHAFVKGQMEVLKTEADAIKVEHMQTELFNMHVEEGHTMQVQDAFFGYTGGAVKELSKLAAHAFWVRDVDIYCPLDRKEVVSGLIHGHENAFTFRELARAYNAHYDLYYPMLLEKFEKGEINEKEFQKYGFHRRQSERIKGIGAIREDDDPRKTDMTLPELYSLGVWLFGEKSNPDEDRVLVKKESGVLRDEQHLEIPDNKKYIEEWQKATGFTEDVMYGDRDYWTKWIMFQLKAPTMFNVALRKMGYKVDFHGEINDEKARKNAKYGDVIGKYYGHNNDYYHRSLSMGVGGQIGRAQMRNRQEAEDRLSEVAELVELLKKEHPTTDEQTRIAELVDREDARMDAESIDQGILNTVADTIVRRKAQEEHWELDPHKQTKEERTKVENYRKWVQKRLQQRWAESQGKRATNVGEVRDFADKQAWDIWDDASSEEQ
ncbi:hypothetical protein A2X44_03405 [candidate division CPR3 bacterium GWF2_35_18]|uniref:Uncharacterized protein n=1 Tax=candidate division CPR3 bacterium GW2011_GWF2_35_18 TaxID=1618350 RepID=A0A0G0BJ81_UNCC3|nr:MAG: hypothetical protein UR67_C0005G0043 [candidate division CPR3 bacterium GW2011_GWF2_35_18]KKP85812.1 MAG: hypothetical protein UR87_C0038G0002 [candidate division CPR3 bacterium GW2011_GWE2_35_7]OGB63026.1 MAG: hypothetical protein A2X44_03405 [candidate division CPR3 bacterium GWF2_35_18]OGB63950.1 MAG: hypothetical protein A2250_02800 [candidate division CPR3 bacterium RIFOXYA2_FULL_35_13]OGB76022.1 MAG: hypothetical protein A2476_00555 [candidate division CPR3 bacterium RIFOXYC2_FULL